MNILEGSEHLSITEATSRGISGLIAEAAEHTVVLERHGKPQALVVSMSRVAEFDEAAADIRDLALVLARSLTDPGNRTSFDDVLKAFDLTRTDLQEVREQEGGDL